MASEETASRRRSPRKARRGRSRTALAFRLLVLPAVAAVLLSLFLYAEVTHRFEGHLWALPSRIYSDRVFVHPGDSISADAFVRRLARSGYAAVDADPERPGEFRRSGATLRVFLRAFSGPWGDLAAREVTVRFAAGGLSSIADARGRELARLELEPEVLATLFGPRQEEREIVKLRDVPPRFLAALLAAEDARFYDHHGIDPLAVVRAAFANVRQGRIVQGGSTITQQLVKNLYLGQERTWWRKGREAVMAAMLDLRYSKERILEAYVNEVYLGQRGPVAICGVQAASRFFFGKDLADLDLAESALLAGMIRNPGGTNPFVRPDEARARRGQVLDAMVRGGSAEEAEADRAKSAPLRLGSGAGGFTGAPHLADLVRSQLSADYSDHVLEEGGLRVFTTLDTLLQENAERALREGLERLERNVPAVRRQKAQRRLEGAIVVTDTRTGAILALVGGRDYRGSQFNRVVQARRQPGSCFKPFVYLAGFEAAARGDEASGLTPASILQDEPLELVSGGKLWRPENYDGLFRGQVTARRALESSLNVPTIRAARQTGLRSVVRVAERCGLAKGLSPLPSLALGAQEVSPLELASAYGTLARLGMRRPSELVRGVVGADGKTISLPTHAAERVVSPEAAYLVTDVLRGVFVRGTAASAAALGFEGQAAGKTGTTDDTRDAWFVGYTPEILALVWVGYDDNAKTGLTGASGALPIWVDFMMRSRGRWGYATFPRPDGVETIEIDPESGMAATPDCPTRQEELFIAGTEPEECPVHSEGLFRWFRRLFRRGDGSTAPEA